MSAVPDWHYRVPIAIPSNASENCTIRLDVDFNGLFAAMGVPGHFDTGSPRVVRSGGSLASVQQFTDTVFNGATDDSGNGRGEIRFILEDDGPVTYYLYFDVEENGIKPGWDPNETINGNFEFLDGDRRNPPGWTGYAGGGGFQAETIDNTLAMTVSDTDGQPGGVSTDEDARTGDRCYLMGARDSAEPNGSSVRSAYLRRRINLPDANRGLLRIRFRVKGWDSSDGGENIYDFIRIQVRRNNIQVLRELVGPGGGNYTVLPFSPNQGTGPGSSGHPGYGIYNGGSSGTVGALPEQWFEAVFDLSSTNRNHIVLYIETTNTYLFKSWFHIDDVEWSVVEAGLGTPEPFGVDITIPGAATVYTNGDTLSIQAQVDAGATAVRVDLFNPVGTLVMGGISLYNDGTHGDPTSGDAVWTNDGSVPPQGTYTFLSTDMPGTDWQVVVTAQDTQIGVTDAQSFTLVTPPSITLLKTVRTLSDPVNAAVDPKAIPGAIMEYTIIAGNNGGTGADSDTVAVTEPIPDNTSLVVGDLGQPGGPVAFIDGGTSSGMSFDPAIDLRFSDNNGASFLLNMGDLVADANGCDPRITHFRVNPEGAFAAALNGDAPRFTLRFRVRIR